MNSISRYEIEILMSEYRAYLNEAPEQPLSIREYIDQKKVNDAS